MLRVRANKHDTLLTSEFLPVMKNAVDLALDNWLKGKPIVGAVVGSGHGGFVAIF